jgi:hydroxylamine reductase
VDFDADRFVVLIRRCVELRDALKAKIFAAGGKVEFQGNPPLKLDVIKEGLVKQGEEVSLDARPGADLDVRSLQHALLFGLKGVAAYAYHARILGQEDQKVYDFIDDALDAILTDKMPLGDWLATVLGCGEINLRTMEIFDLANTGAYGHPAPTAVPLGAKKGTAILVSGHDLKNLEDILVQTEGKGIYVYTHGEMLPAHGYPGLKKYAHFYGHYGTAWQNQHKEFAEFPGVILMTTNRIQKPQESHRDNIFTAGTVGRLGVRHIADKDFTPVIERSLSLPGFEMDGNGTSVTVGFARQAILGVADKVVVLTLGCGKFRFFDKVLGDIGGIPRLLDLGQCNDVYSAIQVALALAQAFDVGVNELPLSMVLSWYEQKAVAILPTLLYPGVKDVRLGPSLPAFITPNILKVLVENYNIKPIATPEEDIGTILG